MFIVVARIKPSPSPSMQPDLDRPTIDQVCLLQTLGPQWWSLQFEGQSRTSTFRTMMQGPTLTLALSLMPAIRATPQSIGVPLGPHNEETTPNDSSSPQRLLWTPCATRWTWGSSIQGRLHVPGPYALPDNLVIEILPPSSRKYDGTINRIEFLQIYTTEGDEEVMTNCFHWGFDCLSLVIAHEPT